MSRSSDICAYNYTMTKKKETINDEYVYCFVFSLNKTTELQQKQILRLFQETNSTDAYDLIYRHKYRRKKQKFIFNKPKMQLSERY